MSRNLRKCAVSLTAGLCGWCHDLTFQFSALPPGSERDHFLALATPLKISTMRKIDPRMFEPAEYGHADAAMSDYQFSAA